MINSPLYNSNNLLQEYKQILEGITDGFFALDEQYHFTYWNKAAEEGTNLSRAEVLGKNVFEVFPNAKDVELGEKYRAAMETKTFQQVTSAYKDERFDVFYDVRVFPMENGILVFFHDETEEHRRQKQKESLLNISQAINVAESIEDLCVEAGKHIARFLEIPEMFVCIYRYEERSEMLHLTAPELKDVTGDDIQSHQSLLIGDELSESPVWKVAQSRQQIITDELLRGTVTKHFLSDVEQLKLKTLIVLPLMVEGELLGVLEAMSFKDTDYVNHELQLLTVIANELAAGMSRKRLMEEVMVQKLNVEQQAKKTAEANATLKRFLATFSHDLRSPLASIVGFSELIANDLETLEPTQVQEFMRTIVVSGKHLQSLIGDILDLSKIEAGALELHIVNYPVTFFTDSISRIMQSQLDEKKLSLHFQLDADVDVISVDQTRFQQVLVNLISNAIKFSPENGKITVAFHRVDNDVEFSVRDEGKGIPDYEITKLFQPFHQAQGNTSGGTGLGLAISKKLVELHKGKIWVESETGKYTEFKFRLPIVVSKDETIHNEDEEMLSKLLMEHITRFRSAGNAAEETKPVALLVDDSEHTLQLLQNYFHSAGFVTEVARNGMEALEKAKELKPDVITLDILLPVQNGWRVMKELKEHPVTKHIPVIVVSVTDQKTLGFSMGAADYFVKPVSKEELLIAVKRALIDSTSSNIHIPTTLVIDDDENFSELIDVMLSGEGLSVLKATTGREGLMLAEQSKPDVIILDMMLPDMNGIEVASELKQNIITRDIPILILTSMDIDDDMREQLDGIARTMMSKTSFTKKDVLREIGSIERKM